MSVPLTYIDNGLQKFVSKNGQNQPTIGLKILLFTLIVNQHQISFSIVYIKNQNFRTENFRTFFSPFRTILGNIFGQTLKFGTISDKISDFSFHNLIFYEYEVTKSYKIAFLKISTGAVQKWRHA
jgi:hypothetical protein